MQENEEKKIIDDRYLNFSLGSEEYAIPLLSVKEVIAVPEVRPMPFSPVYLLGLMNLRGQIIPIFDLRKKLNVKHEVKSDGAVIICDMESLEVGVLVDSVNSVYAPDPETISEPPATHNKNSNINLIFRKDNKLVLVIDIKKTFNEDDHKVAASAKTAA